MFIAAIMHYFAFSHKPFIDQNAPQGMFKGRVGAVGSVSYLLSVSLEFELEFISHC